MSIPKPPPLWVILPNILVPQAAGLQTPTDQQSELLGQLPRSLQQALSRHGSGFTSANGLDPLEAWLATLFSEVPKYGHYPPWAMITNDQADCSPPLAHTRWFGTVSHLGLGREGAQLMPPEELQITANDLTAFWACVTPILEAAGWSLGGGPSEHMLLDSPVPVPMEQASPSSAAAVQLADTLPRNPECSAWRSMWLTLQVELAQADFNLAREQAGLPVLNCLWFWGGGQPWPTDRVLPQLKCVQKTGLIDLAGQLLDRGDHSMVTSLQRWLRLLRVVLPGHSKDSDSRGLTLYVVDFPGWGIGPYSEFDVLEDQVVGPVRLAGLEVGWGLFGQMGWRQLQTSWVTRVKFWRNTPKWSDLLEPVEPDALSEESLRAAWDHGLAQQQGIEEQWKKP